MSRQEQLGPRCVAREELDISLEAEPGVTFLKVVRI